MMKLRESIQLERSEFRRAVERAKKTYGNWLDRCVKTVDVGSRRGQNEGEEGEPNESNTER